MKKNFVAVLLIAAFTMPGCATILGGKVSDCQRTKPTAGQPSRKVRVGALIADVALTGVIGTGIDFLTGAIYKPCEPKK